MSKIINKFVVKRILKKGKRKQVKLIDKDAERKAKKRFPTAGREAQRAQKQKIKKRTIKRQKRKGIL